MNEEGNGLAETKEILRLVNESIGDGYTHLFNDIEYWYMYLIAVRCSSSYLPYTREISLPISVIRRVIMGYCFVTWKHPTHIFNLIRINIGANTFLLTVHTIM